MKVYIARDWTGSKVFAELPVLMKCGGIQIYGVVIDFRLILQVLLQKMKF